MIAIAMVIDYDGWIKMAMAESKGLSYDLTLLCAHPKNSHHIRVGPDLLAKVILMRIVAGLGLKYTDMSSRSLVGRGVLAGLLNSKGKLRHMFHVGGTCSTPGETRLFN